MAAHCPGLLLTLYIYIYMAAHCPGLLQTLYIYGHSLSRFVTNIYIYIWPLTVPICY